MKVNDRSSSKKQLHLVKMFGAIFTANMVTWLPIMVVVLATAILGSGRVPTVVYSIAYLSYLSETVIHAVLAALLIPQLKVIVSDVTGYCRS